MIRIRAARHAVGIALLALIPCAPLSAVAGGGKGEITQPKHPGPRVITVSAAGEVAQPLPRLSRSLPRLKRRLPRLDSALPRLDSALPRLDGALPRLARRLPRLAGPPVKRLLRVRGAARARGRATR